MTNRLLELAIKSIRVGQMDEGARLLRIALKGEMSDDMRAVAYLWMAETQLELDGKLNCYRQAQHYDPTNQEINKRVSSLLASQLPSGNTPRATATGTFAVIDPQTVATSYAAQAMPANTSGLPALFGAQPPLDVSTFQHTLAVHGGPNGVGAGFFISQQGIVATTRHVVGANVQVDIVMNTGQALRGFVVRSYALFDLAFVRVNAAVRQLSPFATTPVIMDHTPLVILDGRGQGLRTTRRATRQETPAHWFPTMTDTLADAGGDPVFDDRGILIGMMTQNAFPTNRLLYGLSVVAIATCLDSYLMEVRQAGNTPTYCPSCGAVSRAPLVGGFYCETCGAALPQFATANRFPVHNPNLVTLYNENNPPCGKCGARVGYWKNKCLRCEDLSL